MTELQRLADDELACIQGGATCTASVSYDTQTGQWTVTVTCTGTM